MKKKLIILATMLIGILSAGAEPLFPFFVDLVMDFDEVPGTTAVHYVGKTNGGGEAAANAFLKDVLPTSYNVSVNSFSTPDGNRIRTFSSAMLDGKISVIYFITTPEGFTIEYAEGLPEAVPPYTGK